jgi:hypothetical protein
MEAAVHRRNRGHGEPEADSIHQSRIAAIVVAHETARREKRDLVIRGRGGALREHVSYRDEPPHEPTRPRRTELRSA